jgi:hypothetical protein
MKNLLLLFIALSFALAVSFSCDRHPPASRNPSPEGGDSKPRESRVDPTPAAPPPVVAGDPEIVGHLDRVARVCDVQPWGARVTCPNREEDQVRSWFASGKKTLAAAVEAAAGYITARDEVGQAVAVDALRRVVNNLDPRDLRDRPQAVAFGPEQWRRFREAADRIANPRLYIALDSSLAVLSALAGQETEFFVMMAQKPAVRIRALPHLLRFSRLRAFGELRKVTDEAMGAGDLPLVVAGLSSAARMPEPTPEEAGVLCAWAEGLFIQSPPHLWTTVAKIYRSCPDRLGPLVTHLEKEWLPGVAVAGEVAVVGDLLKAHCPKASTAAGSDPPAPAITPSPECPRLRLLVLRLRDSPETRPEVRRVCEAVAPK